LSFILISRRLEEVLGPATASFALKIFPGASSAAFRFFPFFMFTFRTSCPQE
jgi:hypothetical protein